MRGCGKYFLRNLKFCRMQKCEDIGYVDIKKIFLPFSANNSKPWLKFKLRPQFHYVAIEVEGRGRCNWV
jgi:hypothetical protein